ncbi:MAG: NAD(P)H-dependent oxidoreductase [Candidatus Gracilibacteria bacterium]
MHTLIITAHPSSHGFTHAIAASYQGACEAKGYTTELLDLYQTELKMDFLRFDDQSDLKQPTSVQRALQAKITDADELVFIFPIWWVNIPAILKNFFDTVLTPGFAYKYRKGSMFPRKLLTGKKARIFCTCDARGWLYWFIGNPLRVILQIGTLGWCGIKVKSYTVFDQMRKTTENDREKMLSKVSRMVS